MEKKRRSLGNGLEATLLRWRKPLVTTPSWNCLIQMTSYRRVRVTWRHRFCAFGALLIFSVSCGAIIWEQGNTIGGVISSVKRKTRYVSNCLLLDDSNHAPSLQKPRLAKALVVVRAWKCSLPDAYFLSYLTLPPLPPPQGVGQLKERVVRFGSFEMRGKERKGATGNRIAYVTVAITIRFTLLSSQSTPSST